MAAPIGDLLAPVSELLIKILQITKVAAQKEVLTDIAIRPLNLALGFGAIGSAGPGHGVVIAQQGHK